MKHFFKSTFALLLILAVVSGCKKDNEEEEETSVQTNQFKIGSDEYAIDKMALITLGSDSEPDDGYDWEGDEMLLVLYTETLSLQEDEDGYHDLLGKGRYMVFACYSSSSTQLQPGNYIADESSLSLNTYVEGWYELNFDSSSDEYEDKELPIGNFKVDLSNNVYEITINCKDEDGNDVTGYFKGSADFYDESDLGYKGFKKQN